METRITYKGYINGVYGVYCGFRPKGMRTPEQIPVYYPDEGKIFLKNEKYYKSVILQEGESIEDYKEVDAPGESTIEE